MKWFYGFWFFFCAGWGWLMTTFPESEPEPIQNIALAFPFAVVCFAILTFLALRGSKTPIEAAHLRIELKPWHRPLGVFQFVFVTVLFSSFWGTVFALFATSSDIGLPLKNLGMSIGGLLGVVLACKFYRSHYAA